MKIMKKSVALLAIVLLGLYGVSTPAAAKPPGKSHAASGNSPPPQAVESVTQGSLTVGGSRVDYVATAGTIILKNNRGKPTGSMFYVAYVKSGVKDEGQRPVTFF